MLDTKTASCIGDVTSEDILDGGDLAKLLDILKDNAEAHDTCALCGETMRTNDDETTNHTTDGETDHDADADHVAYSHGYEPQCPHCDSDAKELLDALAAAVDHISSDDSLIADSYFEDYARQYAEDVGAIEDEAHWPATCIDWKQAACELRMDFTEVDIASSVYWRR